MSKPQAFQNWTGILWAIGASIFASFITLSVRGASAELPTASLVFQRFFFSAIILIVFILVHKPAHQSITFSQPIRHIIRGGLVGISTLFGFYALATIDLTAATILFGLAPIFTTLIAVVFLGQSIGLRRGLAIVLGFVGAIIIVNPTTQFEWGFLSALAAAVLFSIALAMSKGLAQKDGAISTLLSTVIMTILVTAPFVVNAFVWPSRLDVALWMALLVGSGLLRQYSDIQAYRFGEAAALAPIFYLRLIFIPLGAFYIFGEFPTLSTWIGGAIIVAATLYITYRERVLASAG